MKANKDLTRVVLEGSLGRKYEPEYYFNIATPSEAIRALCSQIKGFSADWQTGHYQIFIKKADQKTALNSEELNFSFSNTDFIISPAIAGGAAGARIFGGAATTVISAIPGGEALLSAGNALTLKGFSPVIDAIGRAYSSRGRPDQRASFIYNGPVNNIEQGLPIPLVYGQMRIGSVVVSAGVVAEEI